MERVADALYECDGVVDADLSADFEASTLTFHMGIGGPMEPEAALPFALTVVRTALHAAEMNTEGWENILLEPAGAWELVDC